MNGVPWRRQPTGGVLTPIERRGSLPVAGIVVQWVVGVLIVRAGWFDELVIESAEVDLEAEDLATTIHL